MGGYKGKFIYLVELVEERLVVFIGSKVEGMELS